MKTNRQIDSTREEGLRSRPPGVMATRRQAGAETVIEITGVLDAMTLGSVAATLQALAEEEVLRVSFDLSRLRMVDARGLGAVATAARRLRERGAAVQVHGLGGQPAMLHRVMRLQALLPAP